MKSYGFRYKQLKQDNSIELFQISARYVLKCTHFSKFIVFCGFFLINQAFRSQTVALLLSQQESAIKQVAMT